jgi:acetamidase/formamidase
MYKTKFTIRLSAALLLSLSLPAQQPVQQTLLATPTTVAWGFYSAQAKPVLTVHSGDTVKIQTLSTCGAPERLKSLGVAPADIPPYVEAIYKDYPAADKGPGGHILTGPVAIAEAEPGDVLEVRIQKIDIDVPWACNSFGAGRGFLPNDFPYSKARIIPLDRTKMIGHFAPGVDIPLHPFFGSMGIAPASGGKYNSAPPWMHAGNIDNKEMVAGATLYIPVNSKGANFEVGDGHAGQGNGEVDITALETQLTGTFQFIVHKAQPGATQLLWPRGETPTQYIAMAFDPDLTTATEMAIRNMIAFLSQPPTPGGPKLPALTRDDAYALISTACDVDITQLVDTNSGVHVMCPKALFTTAEATH